MRVVLVATQFWCCNPSLICLFSLSPQILQSDHRVNQFIRSVTVFRESWTWRARGCSCQMAALPWGWNVKEYQGRWWSALKGAVSGSLIPLLVELVMQWDKTSSTVGSSNHTTLLGQAAGLVQSLSLLALLTGSVFVPTFWLCLCCLHKLLLQTRTELYIYAVFLLFWLSLVAFSCGNRMWSRKLMIVVHVQFIVKIHSERVTPMYTRVHAAFRTCQTGVVLGLVNSFLSRFTAKLTTQLAGQCLKRIGVHPCSCMLLLHLQC